MTCTRPKKKTYFKVIATEAVLLNRSLLSFVTASFAPVSNVFKNIERNYGLVIETKVQGEEISTNNQRVGGGEVEGMAKIKILDREFELVSQNKSS